MIIPALADDALLADIAAVPATADDPHLWWLGQSGFLLKWRGEYALFDPYLSDSLTRKYAGTNCEHVRMTARCIAPERLDFAPFALASHLHTDHCDAETLAPLAVAAHGRGARLRLLLPRSGLAVARERLGTAPIEYMPMDAGEEVRVGAFQVQAIAAAHPTVERDAQGHCRFLGFLLRAGPWTIYHSGDTLWHDHLVQSVIGAAPDIVLVPINGNRPERGVAGNLNGTEAAALAKAVGASLAIPHHYDMFAFNTELPDEFAQAASRLGQPCRILRNGERWSFRGLNPRMRTFTLSTPSDNTSL
ncbi:L-ascorbate metabolism protein UlaG, beta-lactamase superfamily [uncultured Defluviicoccus sp.]|uniref:L-ascorbate metabolism protein UlaG, beta-lactamase superfamily n=1 Tax=metagenome TaxID=256318 RepID=A0A380TDK3_9ZZZZ|nr:L-ascorbate metabolism protein UlaG, beta-lactamase superfamily [uncultured Defluviicoccus sp.]